MQTIEQRLVQVQDALEALQQAREAYLTVDELTGDADLDWRQEAFSEACTEFHHALTDLTVAARSVRADTERAVYARLGGPR